MLPLRLAGLALIASLLLHPALAQPSLRTLNASSPGERFEVKGYLDRSRLNLVVFVSAHSPASRRLEERLARLSRANDTLAVGLVEIDRRGAREIDWNSPLARQYNLRVVPFPYFIEGNGTTIKQGHEARKEIVRMLDEAGL